MRLLCVGDIHLGRRPARLPAWVLGRIGADALTPAAAWRLAVDEALRLGVDAVLLAGDVVEQNDDFYEAYGDLEAGVVRLAEAGIGVAGVAGNHDVEVLPRLADGIPHFRLLGRGGTWETLEVTGADGAGARILGWSFPERVVRASPLAGGLPPRDGAAPTIGLLHCDRDQSGSPYAPVRAAELDGAPVDAWLLGHVHAPDPMRGPRPSGYLGSLVGLDPGEPGPHGPWLLEIERGADLAMRQLPLAPLRWETREVPLDDLDTPADVHARIAAAVDALHAELEDGGYRPRAVGCRLSLVGRTPHRLAIERELHAAEATALQIVRDDVAYFVDRWTLDAAPAPDLDTLARGHDPVGLLARRIRVLRRDPDDAERRALVEAARAHLAESIDPAIYGPLDPEPPDSMRTAALLERAALRALDELLAQREAAT